MPDKQNIIRVIQPPSEISGKSIEDFIRDLDQVLENSSDEIVLDCSHLHQVTSAHINALWRAWGRCDEKRRAIRLNEPTDGLRRVLTVLDLYDLFLARPAEKRESTVREKSSTAIKGRQAFKTRFPADKTRIHDVQKQFGQFLENLEIDTAIVFEILTVFYEVTTNIRNHGQLNRDEMINFEASYADRKVSMRFIDSGCPFDMTNQSHDFHPQKVISNRQTHGFGLAMIAKLTDSMRYERNRDQCNVLTLEKKWG